MVIFLIFIVGGDIREEVANIPRDATGI